MAWETRKRASWRAGSDCSLRECGVSDNLSSSSMFFTLTSLCFGGDLTVANGPPGRQEILGNTRDAVEADPVTRDNGVYLMREGGELARRLGGLEREGADEERKERGWGAPGAGPTRERKKERKKE